MARKKYIEEGLEDGFELISDERDKVSALSQGEDEDPDLIPWKKIEDAVAVTGLIILMIVIAVYTIFYAKDKFMNITDTVANNHNTAAILSAQKGDYEGAIEEFEKVSVLNTEQYEIAQEQIGVMEEMASIAQDVQAAYSAVREVDPYVTNSGICDVYYGSADCYFFSPEEVFFTLNGRDSEIYLVVDEVPVNLCDVMPEDVDLYHDYRIMEAESGYSVVYFGVSDRNPEADPYHSEKENLERISAIQGMLSAVAEAEPALDEITKGRIY